ncbi:YsnF/AvaK domain-containing protein [Fibrella forsythiae]|uniref:YsnF/AvaK domain-containing protein n=1 Tax=Fibrella forsythiae TaxID=2817061 RepID=A0ABS3JQI6_9BACT|nr:YsnF/AvaK domain-containing protein [Fibrella forsythiae]MBO0952279.1 YsnF/AvaK domain-containing protein [Fibrella forsythiae]
MFPPNPNSPRPSSPFMLNDDQVAPSSTVVIPVIEEQLQVHTEWVETGRVRVAKQVHEETQTIDVPVRHELIDVERVPINRVVDEVPLSRQEGDTLVLPVVREEVVTTIRLVLVEEVRITRRQEQAIDHQVIKTKSETVAIDRLEPTTASQSDSAHKLT